MLFGAIQRPSQMPFYSIVQFMLASLVLGVAVEIVATELLHHYSYNTTMPRLPVFDLGLTPVLQWLLLSPTIFSIADWRTRTLRMEP